MVGGSTKYRSVNTGRRKGEKRIVKPSTKSQRRWASERGKGEQEKQARRKEATYKALRPGSNLLDLCQRHLDLMRIRPDVEKGGQQRVTDCGEEEGRSGGVHTPESDSVVL